MVNDDDQKFDIKDDDYLLDMSQVVVKCMIVEGCECGFIIYDQLNVVLFFEQVSFDQIEDVMLMLFEMDICVVEIDEEFDEGESVGEVVMISLGLCEVVVVIIEIEKLDCIDDFVCMYLCEMGLVELLLCEGEIVIVKWIEVGCNMMIVGLCESLLIFKVIIMWWQEFLDEDILLCDVIDLEIIFGCLMEDDSEDEEVLFDDFVCFVLVGFLEQ